MVDLGMAGTTQAHQILSCVSAALGNGLFVMNFFCRNKPAVLLAHLAERMLTDVSVTDSFPGTAVLLVDVRGTLVLVVLPAGNGCVVFAILSICQLGTAWVRTWAFGFRWHAGHI